MTAEQFAPTARARAGAPADHGLADHGLAGPAPAGRRRFLISALGAAVAALAGLGGFGGRAAASPGGPLAGPLAGFGLGPDLGIVARRHGAYYLVEGWVLTEADLGALGIPVAAEIPRGRGHDL